VLACSLLLPVLEVVLFSGNFPRQLRCLSGDGGYLIPGFFAGLTPEFPAVFPLLACRKVNAGFSLTLKLSSSSQSNFGGQKQKRGFHLIINKLCSQLFPNQIYYSPHLQFSYLCPDYSTYSINDVPCSSPRASCSRYVPRQVCPHHRAEYKKPGCMAA
jgi:hypothetical protein